jgi:ElaB/YqjD/DUF883 family membrane-anchored ribosome-binding protein
MNTAAYEFEQAKVRLASDFRTMITDGEDLLKAVAGLPGESIDAARSRFEERLGRARSALAEASGPLLKGTRETAAVADRYVHGNPWTAIGIALSVGALVGILSAKR